ncbi:2OG-Fe(II) oxygenase [Pseudomonas guariconensis]|uniref:2OG-Fe(II) oxygenase n=1 Tax=Pseudomonas TaxID=286 RepID=UPI001CE410BA|nr:MULTISPECIES: 2OG-Fe(II) oxygenase [Pseudomonas]MCO7636159.1 2OG-Fe(II) oxygenase [Pseudomonas sp. S 311-6]MCO7513146.1 2OG-Fe(II) oxygenase [Pseudomonas putida]MCO7563503.1 2OG-Fe(II) oxygenase [Pseudomonas mosselii]MCO7594620.1 2OG-Fe(II) oxygenase [Pseudomonas guariconensis]MCO7603754.1 2OG-Fe(II) oxygenase [Pseudomonas guariconensis]
MRAMHTSSEHPLRWAIVDDLASRGWSRQDAVLPPGLLRQLAAECRQRELSPASVGRGAGQEVREAIRGDRIQWLEAGQSEACDQYLAAMDDLRQALNQGLYLGLEDFECHFALYPPGAFYRRHLDRFRDDDRRTVSAILYLNEDWQPEDGGQLRMFLADEVVHDVQPQAGCLVVFLSGDIPHEVLPAGRERLSLTGWFRRRGNDPF